MHPPLSLVQLKEKLLWLQGEGGPTTSCGELGGELGGDSNLFREASGGSPTRGGATAAGNSPLSPVAKDISGYKLTLIEEHSDPVPGECIWSLQFIQCGCWVHRGGWVSYMGGGGTGK